MKKIFTIGGSGMVGSRITELLSDKYEFTDLSLTTGVDITNPKSLDIIRNDKDHEVVIHLAAKADVDGCEVDKKLGEEGPAYKINVQGSKNVAEACLATDKKMIYISTDFVFDGDNVPDGGYKEEDIPCPMNWYAQTKYKGEEVIKSSGVKFVIARIAYPYRKDFDVKKDFVRAIADRLKNNQQVMAITDHIMTPTFIDDLAYGIDRLIETDYLGVIHVTGSQSLTPYEAAMMIFDKFGLNKNLITKTTRAEYFKNKAYRPFNVSMNNGKIRSLGVNMKTFEEGLESIL